MDDTNSLVATADLALTPVMAVEEARHRLQELQRFCQEYLQESKDGGADGGDYGLLPGAGKKRVLYKSGADKLCDLYGLADRYTILSKVEDYEKGLFDYTVECSIHRRLDGLFIGSGLGSCSSYESKYRWRNAERICPQCGQAAIIRGKAEYGGGWLCFKRKGGCGATYAIDDPVIAKQPLGRVENPDIADTKNTVLKMAKKRAKVDAVIGVTRSSGLFSQDVEDHIRDEDVVEAEVVRGGGATAPAPPVSGTQETHAERIARIKREAKEAAAGQAAQQAQPSVPKPPAPIQAQPDQAQPEKPPPPEGCVYVVGTNVRYGPKVMKDGKAVPAWGPLYIIVFSHKVKASDGLMVADATTFSESLMEIAEEARKNYDAGNYDKAAVIPKVDRGSKKGQYDLVEFAFPA